MDKSITKIDTYVGMVLEGRWKVVFKYRDGYFKLVNIYNKQIMKVHHKGLYHIVHGLDTISKLRARQMAVKKYGARKCVRTKGAKYINNGDWFGDDSCEPKTMETFTLYPIQ